MDWQQDRQLAYFSLGSNLGDREAHLRQAVRHLEDLCGEKATSSRFYRSEPWGYSSENVYYNCCIVLPGNRSPLSLFRILQQVEAGMGRTRGNGLGGYADREIDIDLILFGEWVVEEPGLVIPHPMLHERRFVLQPLVEIAPLVRHPVLDKTISELLAACPDPSVVSPL